MDWIRGENEPKALNPIAYSRLISATVYLITRHPDGWDEGVRILQKAVEELINERGLGNVVDFAWEQARGKWFDHERGRF